MNMEALPKWERELFDFKGIKSAFIIEGNIKDKYPYFLANRQKDGRELAFLDLNEVLKAVFSSEQMGKEYDVLFCDPIFGFREDMSTTAAKQIVLCGEDMVMKQIEETRKFNGKTTKHEAHGDNKSIRTSEIIREILTRRIEVENEKAKPIAVIINFASWYLSSPDNLSVDDIAFFLNLQYATQKAIKVNDAANTLVLIVNKFNDLPAWLFLDNPQVRMIHVYNPDTETRRAYIGSQFPMLKQPSFADLREKYIDLTEGMKLLEIDEVRRLHKKTGESPDDILESLSIYKYGFKDSPWEKMGNRIDKNPREVIEKRVLGQPNAVSKIIQMLKRAVTGLSGMQHSSETSKPRGILFLAGPTGTGKTEMVKAVAELLFHDERSILRFDMSEYTESHADQKLFGAPPGYVGYDNGGQLTNAVKNNPCSIILFDEIEKAHPSIMDKFLQILEDGRMTDGQGNTVYFSETLIFFTSNVGISREIPDPVTGEIVSRENIVKPGDTYEEIEEKVEKAMRTYFKPEVLNRIGDNVIVFNYIDESTSRQIAEVQVNRINLNIEKRKGILVKPSQEVYTYLFDLCWQEKVRENGGRGIGNVIEKCYLNPLAEAIFDLRVEKGSTLIGSIADGEIVFEKE